MKQETLIIANHLSGRIADLKDHRDKIMKCSIPSEQVDDGGYIWQGRTFRITTVSHLEESGMPYDSKLRPEFLPDNISDIMFAYIVNLEDEILRLENEFAAL
jgi:hypothetical protein